MDRSDGQEALERTFELAEQVRCHGWRQIGNLHKDRLAITKQMRRPDLQAIMPFTPWTSYGEFRRAVRRTVDVIPLLGE